MNIWIIPFVVNRILAALCPYCPKAVNVISVISTPAVWVFIVLTFFFASHWWYGLISLGIYFITPLLQPRINPESMSEVGKTLSGIGSIIGILAEVAMFILLFV